MVSSYHDENRENNTGIIWTKSLECWNPCFALSRNSIDYSVCLELGQFFCVQIYPILVPIVQEILLLGHKPHNCGRFLSLHFLGKDNSELVAF